MHTLMGFSWEASLHSYRNDNYLSTKSDRMSNTGLVDAYKCVFSIDRSTFHVYIFISLKFIEQQKGRSSKMSIRYLKWPTHTIKQLKSRLQWTTVGRPEEQMLPCPQFRRHESIRNLQVNVFYANTESQKLPGMRASTDMLSHCQSSSSGSPVSWATQKGTILLLGHGRCDSTLQAKTSLQNSIMHGSCLWLKYHWYIGVK